MMANSFNVWNKWGRLKTVMLGQCYPSSFFKDIKNQKIKSALDRITEETQSDLENYERVLRDFGCQVLRPEIDPNSNIMDYIDQDGRLTVNVPRSPLQPRDKSLVIGNTLYHTGFDHPSIKERLDQYDRNSVTLLANDREELRLCEIISETKFTAIAGCDWKSYDEYRNDKDYFIKIQDRIVDEYKDLFLSIISAPCATVVGKDIYVDTLHMNNDADVEKLIDYLKRNIKGDFRYNCLKIGGHNDGCFHTVKPGAILSLFNIQHYKDTFPGWDVCYLPDQSWAKIDGFLSLKEKVSGKWWVPGEEDNDEFTHFVETWLTDWVGYVEETVFDVNVLVLDDKHVCVNNLNPAVIQFLKKHKMEPVHVPFRHRYFWDGGLHCLTLDLYREGTQEDYFPDRSSPIFDDGYH